MLRIEKFKGLFIFVPRKRNVLYIFYPSIFKIRMSLTHFRIVFPFYIPDFLMFRTIQSLRKATMGWVGGGRGRG